MVDFLVFQLKYWIAVCCAVYLYATVQAAIDLKPL